MLGLFLLAACGSEVVIGYEATACEDWSYETSEGSFELDESASEFTVYRVGVIRGCDDEFEPTITGQGADIVINEQWVDRGGDCEVCRVATVHVYDPRPDEYNVYWFDDTSAVTPVWSEVVDLR